MEVFADRDLGFAVGVDGGFPDDRADLVFDALDGAAVVRLQDEDAGGGRVGARRGVLEGEERDEGRWVRVDVDPQTVVGEDFGAEAVAVPEELPCFMLAALAIATAMRATAEGVVVRLPAQFDRAASVRRRSTTLCKLARGLEINLSTLFRGIESGARPTAAELADYLACRTPKERELAWRVVRCLFDDG